MKCCVESCPRPPRGRANICEFHRNRRRRGVPLEALTIRSDWGDKFLAYMNPGEATDCWEWTGPKNSTGYGALVIARNTWTAHRLSYLLHNGDIPEGAFICHRCDNPPCVNPAHLYAGTPADNVRDREERNRSRTLRGEANGMALLTEDSVRAIRSLVEQGIPRASIAEQFGVCKATVSHIAVRRNWSHVA